MILKRTFYSVGHGAFYVERFYGSDGSTPVFTAVFDCGCYNKPLFKSCQKRIIQRVHTAFSKGEKVDVLFLSHFHTDHINGVETLINHCSVDKIVLPLFNEEEKVLLMAENIIELDPNSDNVSDGIDWIIRSYNAIFSDAQKLVFIEEESEDDSNQDIGDVFSEDISKTTGTIPSGKRLALNGLNWEYIPVNSRLKESREKELKKELKNSPVFGNLYVRGNDPDWRQFSDYVKQGHLTDLQKVMKKVFNGNHNEYSMTVLSHRPEKCHQPCEKYCHKAIPNQNRYCTLNCLYMGDFDPKQGIDVMLKRYDDLRYVGMIQIPHHGSRHNHDDRLYTYPKVGILSVDQQDNFNHPDSDVLQQIRAKHGIVIPVTENSVSEQVFRYDGI